MYPELFAELLRSGVWSEEDLRKVAGLNLLRVFSRVEKVVLHTISQLLKYKPELLRKRDETVCMELEKPGSCCCE